MSDSEKKTEDNTEAATVDTAPYLKKGGQQDSASGSSSDAGPTAR